MFKSLVYFFMEGPYPPVRSVKMTATLARYICIYIIPSFKFHTYKSQRLGHFACVPIYIFQLSPQPVG